MTTEISQPEPTIDPTMFPPAHDEATAALMLGFESIGERCDFGAVQRHFGVEPFGLLRFAWTHLDSLVAALDDRFAAVGGPDDTGFELYGEETIVRMKKYNLIFHTLVNGMAGESPEKQEAFRQKQRLRLSFLKDKLVSDLAESRKIFVYSTDDYVADADVARLFSALQTYGRNSLLYVRPARGSRPQGTVEMLGERLYAGYFPGLADFVSGHQPPFALWRELCLCTRKLASDGAASKTATG